MCVCRSRKWWNTRNRNVVRGQGRAEQIQGWLNFSAIIFLCRGQPIRTCTCMFPVLTSIRYSRGVTYPHISQCKTSSLGWCVRQCGHSFCVLVATKEHLGHSSRFPPWCSQRTCRFNWCLFSATWSHSKHLWVPRKLRWVSIKCLFTDN